MPQFVGDVLERLIQIFDLKREKRLAAGFFREVTQHFVPIAVIVLISLSVAVMIGRGFIGQGMMFVNQTVVSSILVVALYRSGVGYERIADALIGGCLAIIFAALLFPADPLTLLRRARVAALERYMLSDDFFAVLEGADGCALMADGVIQINDQ